MVAQPRILVVEDDPDAQTIVAEILNHRKYPVDIAGDVDTALAFLAQYAGAYRLAIIDLALPIRDGWDLLDEIKTLPNTAGLACIALTAFYSSRTHEQALLAGFTACLPKPINVVPFVREIEALVKR